MKELKLKDNNPDRYVIVKLANGTMFVHDKENGKNYFSQKAIIEITGSTQQAISKHINRYNDEMSNTTNSCIALNIVNSTKPVKFYDFDTVTYIVYRSNSLKAIQMRNYISDSIDEKFNKDTGFVKSIEPSREDKILLRAKKQQAKIRTETDSLYVELNFRNPSPTRAKEILKRLTELKPEELRLQRQIQNINNCFGSLNRETSARSQSTLLDFNDKSKDKRRLL